MSEQPVQTIHLLYFSATQTTRGVVETVAKTFPAPHVSHDLLRCPLSDELVLAEEDLLIAGMPVYAGRIPALAAENLSRLKGNNTPAVVMAVYGNRDYDDALLELADILEAQGFRVIAGAAFVAQHSIVPAVGHGRPDNVDRKKIEEFGGEAMALWEACRQTGFQHCPRPALPGNRPYREPGGGAGLSPSGGRACDGCGVCVNICPTKAIPAEDPKKSGNENCIQCAACVTACPKKTRRFRGFKYFLFSKAFARKLRERKEPELFLKAGEEAGAK